MIFAKTKDLDADTKMVSIFSAIGDKTRLRIIKILKAEPGICVSELANKIGISTAGVSQQLKVLESAGLISPNRMGQKTCYQINADTEVNRKLYKLIG